MPKIRINLDTSFRHSTEHCEELLREVELIAESEKECGNASEGNSDSHNRQSREKYAPCELKRSIIKHVEETHIGKVQLSSKQEEHQRFSKDFPQTPEPSRLDCILQYVSLI